MRSLRSQLTLAAVALLLGVLVVIQLRAQNATSSLDSRSVQELTDLVALLNKGNDDLRVQLADEKQALGELQSDIARGQNAATDLQRDLLRIRGWAGLDSIDGPGIRVIVVGGLSGDGVENIVNELWSLGADGVAVDGVRIAPGVVVAGAPHQLTIGGKPIGDTIEITAIGDREALVAGLSRAGGVISVLTVQYPDVNATISREDDVVLPATDRTLTPHDGVPRL